MDWREQNEAEARLRAAAEPVRLVYIGSNPLNASGFSAKFYEIRPGALKPNGAMLYVARWGKIGTRGQEKRGLSLGEAEAKLREKFVKGYRVAKPDEWDSVPVASVPQKRGTLLDSIISLQTWRDVNAEKMVDWIASRGAFELISTDTPALGTVKVYADADGDWWAVTRSGDAFRVAFLGTPGEAK